MNSAAWSVIKAVLFVTSFSLLLAGFSMVRGIIPPQFERYSYGIMGTIAAVIVTWIFTRTERKTFSDFGLNWTSRTLYRFFAGFLIGVGISGFMIGCTILFSNATVQNTNNHYLDFLMWGCALLPLALMEEIAFRAYPFIKLNRAVGVWLSQIIIAILFALYHVAGGQSIISSFLGPGIWSFVFGAAVLLSGGIACATGLHFSVNLVLAALGFKQDFMPLWTISFPNHSTANIVSIILQIMLLILGIAATAWYLKTKNLTVKKHFPAVIFTFLFIDG